MCAAAAVSCGGRAWPQLQPRSAPGHHDHTGGERGRTGTEGRYSLPDHIWTRLVHRLAGRRAGAPTCMPFVHTRCNLRIGSPARARCPAQNRPALAGRPAAATSSSGHVVLLAVLPLILDLIKVNIVPLVGRQARLAGWEKDGGGEAGLGTAGWGAGGQED